MSQPKVPNPSRRAALAVVCALHTSTLGGETLAWGQSPAPAPEAPSTASSTGESPPRDANDDATRERARAAYGAGKQAYAAGDHAAAAAHFALADSLIPAPQAKYWRAMSLDALGNVPDAFDAFAAVLDSPNKERLGAEQLAEAKARHAALAATPATVEIRSTPPGAHVRVSGVDLSQVTPTSVRLAAGRHRIELSLGGYQNTGVELQVRPGSEITQTLPLSPVALQAPALSAPPAGGALVASGDHVPGAPERSLVPGYVTLGIAGASAIVGTVFGVRALSDKKDFEDGPTTSAADDVERNALIADMAFGVTLTLGITGLVLLFADDPMPEQASSQPPERTGLSMVPYVTPSGGGAAASLRF